MPSTYVPVNIYVVDNTPQQNPIQGAAVNLYTTDTHLPVTRAITDINGLASFLLPSEFTFEMRMYKNQTTFSNPQLLPLLDPPAVNNFTVVGTPFAPPIAQDPSLCMAYGFFRTVTGAPAPNLDIQFIAQFDPLIFYGSGMVTERAIARTDQNGYVQVPLARFGMYSVILAGFEDLRRTIKVPDAPNINLPDLIWPVVSSVVYDQSTPFNLTIGTDFYTKPTVSASDGEILEGVAGSDVRWDTADHNIAAVLPAGDTLTLRGLSPGTTSLILYRLNYTIIRIPDPGILGNNAVINVM